MHLDAAHHCDHVVRELAGADDRHAGRHHDGRRIAAGEHAEVGQADRVTREFRGRDRTFLDLRAQALDRGAHAVAVEHVGIAQCRHEQAVVGIHRDAEVDMRMQGAGEVGAVEPGIEGRHGLAGGHDRAHEACGDVLAAAPRVQVGVVDQRGRYHLRVRIGHDPRHVAAHALQLLGLATRDRPRRLRAHRLAGLRQRAPRRHRRRSDLRDGRLCAAASRCGPRLGRPIRRRALHVIHRHRAIGAGRGDAADVDAELACGRAHRRHRLDATGGDRGLRHHGVTDLHRADDGACIRLRRGLGR